MLTGGGVAAVASKLAFVPSVPATEAAGVTTNPITVQVQDQFGNLVSTDNNTSLTLSVNGVVVSTMPDTNGSATFSGLQFTKTGTETISVTSNPPLTAATARMTVVPAAADHLAFVTTPNASIVAGVTEAPVQVVVEDAFNNIIVADASHVTASFSVLSGGPTNGGSFLANAPTTSQLNGRQYFSNIIFDVTGRYSMNISDPTDLPNPNSTISAVTTVNNAPAVSMAMITALSGTNTTNTYSGQVQIGLYDQFGNLAVQDHSTITLSLGAGQTFGNGQSTLTTTPINGVAYFATFRNTEIYFNHVGTYSITATDSGSSLHGVSLAVGTVTINPAAPTISMNPVNITYGTPLANSQLSGSATDGLNNLVAGTYTYAANVLGTTLGAGNNQSVSVTFTPQDLTNFSPVTTTVVVNVAKYTPSVLVNPVNITYGTPLDNSQLSGTATDANSNAVAGTYTYDPNVVGTNLNGGNNQSVLVTFTPQDLTDFNPVTTSVLVSVAIATPTVVVTANGGINPGPTQVLTQSFAPTATATVGNNLDVYNGGSGGTFSYTYYAGVGTGSTPLTAAPTTIGTYTVVASFTSAHANNYSNANSSPVTYTITDAPTHVAIVPISAITAGSSTGTISVQVLDKYNNLVVSDTTSSVTLKYPNGSLVTSTDVNGVATFSGAVLNTAGMSYFYAYGSYNATTFATVSMTVVVNAGAANKLAVVSAPVGQIKAGVTEAPVQVAVEDAFGNIIAGKAGNIQISYGTAPTVPATLSTASGKEYFSGIVYNTVGNYTVTFTDATDGLAPTSTYNTSVIANSPTHLILFGGTLPAAKVNVAVPSISLAVYDAYGNLCTNASGTVTLSLQSPNTFSSGASSISVSILNGYATFNGSKALKFSSTGSFDLVATSSAINGYSLDIGSIIVSN